ncbi:MAG: transposase, partial [Elusimicrobiota bacterium]
QAIKDLCLAYKNFFNTQRNPKTKGFSKKTIEKSKRQNRELTSYDLIGHPKFKSKKNSTISFYNDPITLCVKKDKVLLEKIGWVKINELLPEKLSQIDKTVKFYNPRITFDGKYWYISVGIDKEIPVVELTDNSIGIDLGIKELAVTSDNEVYSNINKTTKVKNLKKRLKRKQRQLSRKYLMNKEGDKFKKTKNIIKLEDKVKLLNRRLANIRNNYLHQITTKIVKTKPRQVVMEDLNIKGMMKNRHLSKAIGEQGFNKFITYMKYKSEKLGINFIQVGRFYPSSKMCSSCFNIKNNLKLKDRIYKCSNIECELHKSPIDRDYNASLNLSRYIA